ncbi:P-loop containing nucleoside triphosphate hydrolase protein [Durotheca rogersii]|uniref:P-loop containing nucleoside triphosphate hydrolase protein n=1 Tax=Durotheca rogersii TaxID=419775 RepID=UPI00221F4A5A|nr:P-loop containing nucleoside triphosphate hydrolase protein [Durotheca rogersii]KAI5867575.1 P-loop containing nucleoside triphosphate hydrolase protein [Durotheca rogersii]
MDDWSVAELKAALPKEPAAPSTTQDAPPPAVEGAAPSASEVPKLSRPPSGWGDPVPYDYTESDVNREWGSSAQVYEWDGEMGEVGPEIPELEKQLFGSVEQREGAGLDFSAIAEINVTQEGITRIRPIWKFEEAGLHPVMLKNVEMAGYKDPTPIQKYALPAIKLGHDLIAIAQTGEYLESTQTLQLYGPPPADIDVSIVGSGKTAAYLVPILSHLMGKAKKLAAPRPSVKERVEGTARPVRAEPLVVIICPARELAIQIFNEARKFCYRTMLRPCVVYGGGPHQEQRVQLQNGCDILIGTPGRLVDMMERSDVLSFRRIQYMVIDEADEMLDVDWQVELNKIMSGGEQDEGNVKYMLFSATFPAPVRKLAKSHLSESHVRIRVGRIGSTHANIKQDVIFVLPHLKNQALHDRIVSAPPGRTIIFVNNKRTADEVDDYLFQRNWPCTSMHSDRTQREREDAMRAFRSGKSPVLITTGVTARGIDVRNVKHVINYDLPSMDHGGIQEYIHRIGRTGRIGFTGLATSFYTDRDEPIAQQLVMTLMETKQEVPDFLREYIPEGVDPANFKIEDDNSEASDGEGVGDGDVEGDGWGTGTWGEGANDDEKEEQW